MHAIVHGVHPDGAVLLTTDPSHEGKEVWLPGEEWSDDPRAWETTARNLLAEGLDELDVIYLQPFGGYDGLPTVSRKQFTKAHVENSWLSQRRLMIVTELTKALVRGRIGNIKAVMLRAEYERFLNERNAATELSDHGAIGLDDRIWGIVIRLDGPYGDVELDPVQYLMSIEREQTPDLGARIASIFKLEKHTP